MMKALSHIFSALTIILAASLTSHAVAKDTLPWDAVLIDVSSDVTYLNSDGQSVSNMIYPAVQFLSKTAGDNTIFMPYASGRAPLTAGEIKGMSKQQFFDLSLCFGSNTATLNAIASLLNLPADVNRVLVLTNDRDNTNSFTPATLAEILGAKGITVDAAIFNIQADSLRMPHYPTYYKALPTNGKITSLAELTNGSLVKVSPGDNITDALKLLAEKAKATAKPARVKKMSYDKAIVDKCLSELKPESVRTLSVDTSMTVMYNGKIYHGLCEIRKAAGEKSGIVGQLTEPDSEAVSYCFAPSKSELKAKRKELEMRPKDKRGSLLNNSTPWKLLPLVFYPGEGEEMTICGLQLIYDEYSDKP